MNESPPPTTVRPADQSPQVVKNLELKAALLLLLMMALVLASGAYVLYARGFFERTQQLVLLADDSEGVLVGMDMTFAGFPIGRVARIELADDGNARILIDVKSRDARWLRSSSVFTMERGLVGGTRIRAFSGVLNDPPLENGAVRQILRGDALAELPRLAASVSELLENLTALTAADAALLASLTNLQTVTEKLKGPQGALGVLLGNEAEARKLVERTKRAAGACRCAHRPPRQPGDQRRPPGLWPGRQTARSRGQGGLVSETRTTVKQLNGLLAEVRGSLQKVDAVLVDAHGHCRQHACGNDRSRRAAQRGRSHFAQGRASGQRGQPQMALCPRDGDQAAMRRGGSRLLPALAATLVLTACAGAPPPPDWQMNAKGSLERATEAYLSGNSRREALEFARARAELARTGRADLLARSELLRCATRVASLEMGACSAYEALAADAAPPEQAYARYLSGQVEPADVALLPKAQQGLAANPGLQQDDDIPAEVASPADRRWKLSPKKPSRSASKTRCVDRISIMR
jgi:phospholipid/cholesterol/gamma-HCH transport system substrate-binding protein